MDRNNALTDPKKLVRVELKNAGFDIDKIKMTLADIDHKAFLLLLL